MMPNQNESADKPRRVRTSKPKVKTGCNNCKYVHAPIVIKNTVKSRGIIKEEEEIGEEGVQSLIRY